MIQIVDKNDGVKKLRRGYEDYIPLETPEPQPTTEAGEEIAIPETSEPQQPAETQETTEPTTEPTEAES